ncbi:unnamed protein product [Diamesa serratosioi]
MSCDFGEILEPVSRAFYDDYDEEDANATRIPELKWMNDKVTTPKDLKNFVIVEGVNALNIINCPILNSKSSIVEILNHKVSLYEFSEQKLIICVAEEKDLNYFGVITELLKPWIEIAENVNCISIQSLSEYKHKDQQEGCLIRGIKSNLKDVPELEVPNFITGLSAGIASYRKFKSLSYSVYVAYVDIFDIFSVKAILDLLKKLKLPYNENVKIRALHQKSDLYM